MVAHGDGDPLCCSSQQVVQTYPVNNSELLLDSSEVILSGDIDPAILDAVWHWQGSLYNNDTSCEPENPIKIQ